MGEAIVGYVFVALISFLLGMLIGVLKP